VDPGCSDLGPSSHGPLTSHIGCPSSRVYSKDIMEATYPHSNAAFLFENYWPLIDKANLFVLLFKVMFMWSMPLSVGKTCLRFCLRMLFNVYITAFFVL
jgi:hypothetical protein